MRMFRLLRADEIECRISEVDKQGRFLRLLLYKTARTDAALLDETVGPMNWDNDYRVLDGKMYCGIGIYDKDEKQWVWKWNVGTESNTEAEKGEASDAMKRAGFVWGCGTELYSAPRITIWAPNFENKYDHFDVTKIVYDSNDNISELEIINEKTRRVVFSWTKDGGEKKLGQSAPRQKDEPKSAPKAAPKPEPKDELPFYMEDQPEPQAPAVQCADCGRLVMKYGKLSAEDVIRRTTKQFGVPLCGQCGSKRFSGSAASAEAK